jgi:hypothetical protein
MALKLDSQYLQSYDGLLVIFRPSSEEDHHSFADIWKQAQEL